jgi:predicted nucleic acid-binding protein
MIDLETSVVVALLTPEERSPLALDWLEHCREPLISSDWLITETHSALGIKQRQHGHSPEARQAAAEQFDRLLHSGVELRSLDRARLHQPRDVLHLAVALHSRCSHLASFDGEMQHAATALGLNHALQ